MDETPEPRTPLSKERVLRAAIAIADDEGLGALTMRRLAQRLGVEAMSLYHYARARTRCSTPPSTSSSREIEIAPDDAAWKAALRHDAIAAHAVLRRHPWSAGRVMSARTVSPARLRFMESILSHLRRAGFDPEQTDHAYHALDSHITGFTLWQVSMPFEAEDLPAMGARFLRELPVDEFPAVAEHIEQHLAGIGNSGGTEFAFGLDLILDGLERLLATPAPTRATSACRRHDASALGSPSPRRPVARAGLHVDRPVLQSPAKGPGALATSRDPCADWGHDRQRCPIVERHGDRRPALRPRRPSCPRRSSGWCRTSFGRP